MRLIRGRCTAHTGCSSRTRARSTRRCASGSAHSRPSRRRRRRALHSAPGGGSRVQPHEDVFTRAGRRALRPRPPSRTALVPGRHSRAQGGILEPSAVLARPVCVASSSRRVGPAAACLQTPTRTQTRARDHHFRHSRSNAPARDEPTTRINRRRPAQGSRRIERVGDRQDLRLRADMWGTSFPLYYCHISRVPTVRNTTCLLSYLLRPSTPGLTTQYKTHTNILTQR